jgi:hypothetical protein
LGEEKDAVLHPVKNGIQRSIRFRFSSTDKNLEANAGILKLKFANSM